MPYMKRKRPRSIKRPHHQPDYDRTQCQHGVTAQREITMVEPITGQRSGGISPQGVKAAMGHIEDLHHPVDEGEAHGDNEQPGRIQDPVHQDRQQITHGQFAPARAGAKGTPAPLDIEKNYLVFLNPDLIQSSLLTPSGGLTLAAG